MPAKEIIPGSGQREIPVWNGNSDVVHWKGRTYSLADFMMIRETIRELAGFIEKFLDVKPAGKEELFLHAIRSTEFLKGKLIPMSTEAFLESVNLTVNILAFRECLDDRHRKLAKENLEKIHHLLCLDVMFKIVK